MPTTRLDEIVENKRAEVAARKQELRVDSLKQSAQRANGGFFRSIADLNRGGVHIIAELKPKSPSAGVLNSEFVLGDVVSAYDEFASAISVLTDQKYFGGSLDLLKEVSANTRRPTLCKDFIIDPFQCYEARCYGAQAILLIVKILKQSELQQLQTVAHDLGMSAVVEVQDERELEIALSINPRIILINNRNLSTFEIDLATTEKLAPLIPNDVLIVGASGVESRDDVERLAPFCNALLIGSSIMRASNMRAKLSELCALTESIRSSGAL